MDSQNTVVRKETKNKIHVDYEGKLTFKERLQSKLKASTTWIRVLVTIFRFVMMLGVSFVILFPFISKIAGSFMSRDDVIDPTVSLIAKNPTIEQYKYIITQNQYLEALFNTALLSLAVAIIQTFVSCLIGYGLAKFKFKGNKLVMGLVVFTMIVPHQTLRPAIKELLSNFDIMKPISWEYFWGYEGIVGTIAHVINPESTKAVSALDTVAPYFVLSVFGLAFKNGLYIYLLRQFFKGVPDELEESAYVDGSGTFRTFFQIIIPLAVPMMITVFLFAFSWQWTDQFYHGIFFTDLARQEGALYLIPDILKKTPPALTDTNFEGWTLYKSVIDNTAGIMIIAPLVIIYLFCQKYLVQGIERSGLVG